MNDEGDYFPVWGTCLGFELLTYIDSDRVDHREKCSSENQPLALDFRPGKLLFLKTPLIIR